MAIETQPVTLLTSDGVRLNGDLLLPDPATSNGPVTGAVVCHPHPLYGGDRFNGVVDTVVRALAAAGVVALRFDFRGVNQSEGAHGGGDAERLDVVAAVDTLCAAIDGPIWLVGYSFGAMTVLSVDDARVVGWIAIAPPLAMMRAEAVAAQDPRPTHVVIAGRDQYSPPDVTLPIVEGWIATTSTVLASADHFLAGHLDHVAELTVAAITASSRACVRRRRRRSAP